MCKEINLQPIQELLEVATSPMELAIMLDNVFYQYSQLVLTHDTTGADNVANDLHSLRELRNAFLKIDGCRMV
jgi:hypothetical protein